MEEENKVQKPDITYFAETNFRNQRRRFGIRTDDRRRHVYVIGKTGTGKTNMLEQMVLSDIYNGNGVGLVDPHGDLAEKILDYIPSSRLNDIVYFNPADVDYPIGFNVLETINPLHKHLVASGLMGIFKKIWPDVWSPRMEYILNNCILALLEYPNSTLLGINRLLIDKEYRKRVVTQIQNPVVKTFWIDEYARYSERFATEAIAPIQNKVGQFLSSSIIRNVVAQVKSTIDIREMMDNGKILIMNLSKGRIGEENSRLLGGMLITKLQLAAMERVDVPESERPDFYLFVDEFQNFATESFASILSEARKYHLDLTLAHQYIEQLDEDIRPAVFGNVGSIVCFRVGAADAEFLVKEFTPDFMEEDLVNLPKYNVYLKLMIDGIVSNPFSAQTFLPDFIPTGNREKVIKVSRERFAKPRETIEDKILRWSGMKINGGEEGEERTVKENFSETAAAGQTINRSAKISQPVKTGIKRYSAHCSHCGKETTVPFVPDSSRPVYCVECYKMAMEKKDKAAAPSTNLATKKSETTPIISLSEAYKKFPPPPVRVNPNRVPSPSKEEEEKKISVSSNTQPTPEKKIKPGHIISFDS